MLFKEHIGRIKGGMCALSVPPGWTWMLLFILGAHRQCYAKQCDCHLSTQAAFPNSPNPAILYLSSHRQLVGLLRWLDGKEAACQAGDLGLILESGRSPGGGHGNPF